MVAEGRRKHKNIEFIEADAEKLPFGDNEFDAVTISFGLRNINNPKAALARCTGCSSPAAASSCASSRARRVAMHARRLLHLPQVRRCP